MWLQLFSVLATALLSSVVTLVLAYWLIERHLRSRLERRLEELQEELGAEVQERVRRGIVEGVASLPSTEVLRGTGQTLTSTAGDLVKSGLDTLLGGRGEDPED